MPVTEDVHGTRGAASTQEREKVVEVDKVQAGGRVMLAFEAAPPRTIVEKMKRTASTALDCSAAFRLRKKTVTMTSRVMLRTIGDQTATWSSWR